MQGRGWARRARIGGVRTKPHGRSDRIGGPVAIAGHEGAGREREPLSRRRRDLPAGGRRRGVQGVGTSRGLPDLVASGGGRIWLPALLAAGFSPATLGAGYAEGVRP